MNWIITADVESPDGGAEGVGVLPQMPGQIGRYSKAHITLDLLKPLFHRFRILDDDGLPYYLGYADAEGFAPLDWAKANAGCTEIQFARDDRWETL